MYGRALKICDGDTFIFKPLFRRAFTVRLFGADAYELGQKHGKAAKNKLFTLLDGRILYLRKRGISYDRQVAEVYIFTWIGWRNVAGLMVRSGYAVVDNRFGADCKHLKRAKWLARLFGTTLSSTSPRAYRARRGAW